MDEELPTLREWFAQAPPARLFLFAIASLCTVIANGLGWKLMLDHIRAGTKESERVVFFPEIRKKVLYQIFWLNMLSGTAYCGLLLPKTSLFLEFIMAAYEAWALLGFMRMLIDLMGGKLRMLHILQEQPPRKLFSVMPCCCLVCCDKPRNMSANIMAVCRLGANQAAIVRPLLAAVNLFIQLNGGYQIWASNTTYLIIDILELASKMTSVFFIFVLYGSTQEVLKAYNVRQKFILLRLMFLPFIIQSSVITFIYSFLPDSDEDIFPKVVAAQSWSNCLTCIEVLPIAIALFYVYPVNGEFDLQFIPKKVQLGGAGLGGDSSVNEPLLGQGYHTFSRDPSSSSGITLSESRALLAPKGGEGRATRPAGRTIACQVDLEHNVMEWEGA